MLWRRNYLFRDDCANPLHIGIIALLVLHGSHARCAMIPYRSGFFSPVMPVFRNVIFMNLGFLPYF
jgi:hypothetical protein